MDKLRRTLVLGAASFVAVRPLPSFAAGLGFNLKAKRIAENSYVVIGGTEYFSKVNGGHIVNIAFIDTADGVVVIDTGSNRLFAEDLKRLILKVTGKEIVRVYNTHFHPDHCFGNQITDKMKIAALPKTIVGLKSAGEDFLNNLYSLLGDWMRGTEVVIPGVSIGFSSEKFGSHRFEMIPLEGHTDSDLVILDHKTGVLYSGDLCFLDRAASTPHADLKKWQNSLGELKKTPHKILVPGHGPVDRSARAIEQTHAYLEWLESSLIHSAKSGKTMIGAARVPIPKQFQSMEVVGAELERSVAHLYPAIEKKWLPFVGQGSK